MYAGPCNFLLLRECHCNILLRVGTWSFECWIELQTCRKLTQGQRIDDHFNPSRVSLFCEAFSKDIYEADKFNANLCRVSGGCLETVLASWQANKYQAKYDPKQGITLLTCRWLVSVVHVLFKLKVPPKVSVELGHSTKWRKVCQDRNSCVPPCLCSPKFCLNLRRDFPKSKPCAPK